MKHTYDAFFRRSFKNLFVLAWLAATPVLAAPCADVVSAPLGGDLRTYEIAAGDATLFAVDVPAAGLLVVEASTPVGTDVEPRLALFGDDCRPAKKTAGVRVVARWISAMAIEVDAPGVYRFGVAAQDPREPLAEVTFTSRFADASDLCGARLKTQVEPEPDPDALGSCSGKTQVEPEPDPDALTAGRALLCGPVTGDGHGDVLACAATVVPGKPVTGKLGWDAAADVFTFTVVTQGAVMIGAEGDATIHGALYDSSGHRLAVDGGGEGLRLAGTLAPGHYYVRVGGTGDYALTVVTGSW